MDELKIEEKELHLNNEDMMNKLFCTFSPKESLEDTLKEINKEYTILYKKIFVLESVDSGEFLCTYNIEIEGKQTKILPNTILLHRKKDSNTLYTINALNTLIKKLNNGVLDTSFPINWQDYKNSVLLTQGDDLKKLNTTIHKIVVV
jgi:hypothetical protein